MVGPVPRQLKVWNRCVSRPRACKQIVPLRLEGIETGAIAHDGERDGRRPDVRPSGCARRRRARLGRKTSGLMGKRAQLAAPGTRQAPAGGWRRTAPRLARRQRKERANPRSLAPLGRERNLDQAQQE